MRKRTQETRCPKELSRRTFLNQSGACALGGSLLYGASLEAATRASRSSSADSPGIPGPYPGRVVEVTDPNSVVAETVDGEAVGRMMREGMVGLTGSDDWAGAWRTLFQAGDVVGIKVNPVGAPHAISSYAVVHQIVDGLKEAGVKPRDIIVFDRYRRQFINAGYDRHLPDGVRWDAAVEDYDRVQLDIAGYDPDRFVELELAALGRHDPKDDRTRRSHLCTIVSRKINKLINVPVLKDHGSAGVTLALKNLSHGLVNNVARSHSTHDTNACNIFIPAVVGGIPEIREKTVLHVMDGLKAVYHGGPGAQRRYVWPYRSLFFATDPVAMDRIGWQIIDAKRTAEGMPPVAQTGRNSDPSEGFDVRQPQHIALAAAVGLGVFDASKVEHRKLTVG